MISIKVPPLGESIVEATVARWVRKEGESVAAGDTLVELETDKVTVEVPALKGGVLARQTKRDGDVVAVGDVLGEIDESAAGTAPAPARAAAPEAPAAAAAPAAAPAPAPAAPATPTAGATEVKASPAARRVAAEGGVDLASVTGTGRGGVVSKPDVIEQGGRAAQGDGASARAAEAPSRPAAPTPAPRPASAPPARYARDA